MAKGDLPDQQCVDSFKTRNVAVGKCFPRVASLVDTAPKRSL